MRATGCTDHDMSTTRLITLQLSLSTTMEPPHATRNQQQPRLFSKVGIKVSNILRTSKILGLNNYI